MKYGRFLDEEAKKVSYHPSLAETLGSIKVAVICDRLRHASKSPRFPKDKDGRFWLNLSYLSKSTGMSEDMVRSACDRLRNKWKIAESKWDGFKHRTTWLFDHDRLDEIMTPYMDSLESGDSQDSESGKLPSTESGDSQDSDTGHSQDSIKKRIEREKRLFRLLTQP